jgi:hypothetical protein
MGKKHNICVVCDSPYYGQGKYCCSVECRNIYLTGKKLNITDEHRKMLSEKATKQFKNKKISQEQKDNIGKSSKLRWDDETFYNKMCEIRKGHEVKQETRDKIRNSQEGRENPWTTEYNKNRIAPSGWHHTETSKQTIREKVSGDKNGQYGKPPPIVRGVHFTDRKGRTFKFRSKWEEKLAAYFDNNNIDWNYEFITYKLSDNSTYTPDFFVEDMIYEVKGYPYKRSMEKFEIFRKEYNFLKITLANRQYLTKTLKIKL